MAAEPERKRVVVFFDGQNLFHCAKRAFGHQAPNYDPQKLAQRIVGGMPGWVLEEIRFYTGIHDESVNSFWHHYWTARLAAMGTRGIRTYSRPLRYQLQDVALPNGLTAPVRVGQEKGIDIRIALDMVRMARARVFDVALLFSQDQDLSEAVDEVKNISREQDRWIKVACAFPQGETRCRGVNGTQWIPIDQNTYDQCLDPRDYRPGRKG
jgi:uncharacterized LabA/DUF88 family protein